MFILIPINHSVQVGGHGSRDSVKVIINKNSVSFLFILDFISYQQFINIVGQTSSYDKILSINVITEHDD